MIDKYRLREKYEDFMFFYIFPFIAFFGLLFQFIYNKFRRFRK
jgi:hypothetical protein